MTTYAHSPALQQSLAAWARELLAAEQQIPAAPAPVVTAAVLEQTATGPISLPIGAGWAVAETTAGKRAAWVEA